MQPLFYRGCVLNTFKRIVNYLRVCKKNVKALNRNDITTHAHLIILAYTYIRVGTKMRYIMGMFINKDPSSEQIKNNTN